MPNKTKKISGIFKNKNLSCASFEFYCSGPELSLYDKCKTRKSNAN